MGRWAVDVGSTVPTVVGTVMAKVSISIDDADLRWLKSRARKVHGGNLSAAIAEATRLVRHREALGELLDAFGAPELSPDEVEEVALELGGTPPKPRRGVSPAVRRVERPSKTRGARAVAKRRRVA